MTSLLQKILDAPVGQVITVLSNTLHCDVHLQVVEQNSNTPNEFLRKVSITALELPVIKANVKFDSTILPDYIMAELLAKKFGIGSILNANGIQAIRNIISENHTDEKVTREYEIIYNGVVWFTVLEEIRLGNLGSNNNS